MESKPPPEAGKTSSAPSPSPSLPDTKLKPKRKRKSPAVPWKKPKDMPKRPLSAYNLFFRQEREKMLKAGWKSGSKARRGPTSTPEGDDDDDDLDSSEKSKTGGFANLARTVASKWKTLPPEIKAPFEAEAAREKARYDAQMVGWRAEQEQKKARTKAGAGRNIMDTLTSGATLQSYAAHLQANQPEYPETWFQAADTSSSSASQILEFGGLQQQQQQQQQRTQISQQSMSQHPEDLPPSASEQMMAMVQQANVNQPMLSQLDHPFMQLQQQQQQLQQQQQQLLLQQQLQQQLQQPYVGQGLPFEETKQIGEFNMAQKSMLWPRDHSRRASSTTYELRQENRAINLPSIQHRSSLGAPSGYRMPQHHSLGEEASRMPRSLSYPSARTNPASPQLRGMSDPARSRSAGLSIFPQALDSPTTPTRQQDIHHVATRSPHSTVATSIMTSPHMVPTPPLQQGMFSFSPTSRDTFETGGATRSRSEPPPAFPGDEEFQYVNSRRYQGRRRTFFGPRQTGGLVHPESATAAVGDIRSLEEMAAEISTSRQSQPNASLTTATFEALDSKIDEDDIDFLSNLQFEE